MQHGGRRAALAIHLENDLRVDDLQEIGARSLREHLELRLGCDLSEQVIALPSDDHYGIRIKLILAHVGIEDFRIDRTFLVPEPSLLRLSFNLWEALIS